MVFEIEDEAPPLLAILNMRFSPSISVKSEHLPLLVFTESFEASA